MASLLAQAVAQDVLQRAEDYLPQPLINAVWAANNATFPSKHQLLQRLTAEAITRLHAFTPQELTTLLVACSRLGVARLELLEVPLAHPIPGAARPAEDTWRRPRAQWLMPRQAPVCTRGVSTSVVGVATDVRMCGPCAGGWPLHPPCLYRISGAPEGVATAPAAALRTSSFLHRACQLRF